jgi:hypothetical protein
MAKLRLTLENLRVDSFATGVQADSGMGTVQAHQQSRPLASCAGDASRCIASCGDTCQITCGNCLSVDVC